MKYVPGKFENVSLCRLFWLLSRGRLKRLIRSVLSVESPVWCGKA